MDTFIKKHLEHIGRAEASDNQRGNSLKRLSDRSPDALKIAGVASKPSTRSELDAAGAKVRAGGPSLIKRMTTFFAGWKRPQAKIQLTGNVAGSRTLTASSPKPGAASSALPLPSVYELQTEKSRLRGQLNAMADGYKTLAAEFESFKANPSEQVKSEASRRAATILAGTGCRPLSTGAGDLENGDKIMARTSFSRLSPQEKADFMRRGGKLTD